MLIEYNDGEVSHDLVLSTLKNPYNNGLIDARNLQTMSIVGQRLYSYGLELPK